jgi:single-stranded DNA-binding protein
MNIVNLFGRVDEKFGPKAIPGTDGLRFQLVTTFKGRDGQLRESSYPCVCWGVSELGVPIEPGAYVFVSGRLQNRSYLTAEGVKRWSMEVVTGASGIEILAAEDGRIRVLGAGDEPADESRPPSGGAPF